MQSNDKFYKWFKDCLPHIFHGFRNRHFNQISLNNTVYFHNVLYMFWEIAWFLDKYAMKNNLQNKMRITIFVMAINNVDFDHVYHVNMYR